MSHLQGHPTAVNGTSHGVVWDIPSIEVGRPTFVMGCPMSHSLPRRRHIPMGNTETYPTRALGAYSSKAVGGGAFKGGRRRHLSKAVGKGGRWRHIPTGNAEAHLTRALGAYLSKAVGGGAFKGGRQRHIPTGNAEYFFYKQDIPNFNCSKRQLDARPLG
ncbi:hypothetical protein B0H17DRAFT_1136533 [Mycena rosella]|uniref:Uncharacterized protein n=1 Tax=Mycena rosella TaxID=1033263 RepID=A0AAD7GED2_MYCRO|nr:hypothetical protein B0H17DRAFT_1136533 [Mycena rosella]